MHKKKTKIEYSYGALTPKFCKTRIQFVKYITNEKQCRNNGCSQHTEFVSLNISYPNEIVASEKKYDGNTIEDSIDMWNILNANCHKKDLLER